MYIASLVITINLVYCYIFSVHSYFSSSLSHFLILRLALFLSLFRIFFLFLLCFHLVFYDVHSWPFCQSQSHTTRISYNYIRRIFFIETQRTRLVFNLFYGRGKLYQILLLSSIKILLFVEYCRICLYDLIKQIFGDFLIYSRFSHIRYLNFSGVFLSFLY